jgi:hypothetical protein
MSQTLRQTLILGLVAWLLLLGGIGAVQATQHAAHHAHHQAATHASVLCSWMCAAGQSLEAVAFVFQSDLGPLALADPPVSQDPLISVLSSPVTRGPPFSV